MKKKISDWRGAKGEWQTARASGSSRWLRQGVRSCILSLRRWVGARSNSLNLGACWGAHGCAKSEVAENNGWARAQIRGLWDSGRRVVGSAVCGRAQEMARRGHHANIDFFLGGAIRQIHTPRVISE